MQKLNNESEQLFYILRDGSWSGNSALFWRPNGNGYTYRLSEAGKYTALEAKDICEKSTDNFAYKCEDIENSRGFHTAFDGNYRHEIKPSFEPANATK